MNEQLKVQLLPCPFCGGEAEMIEAHDDDGRFAAVGCNKCGAGSRQHYFCGDDARDYAASAWNTRQAALAHASSATTNPQESSSRLVDARDALRWRALCELIDSDGTIYTHLITVINDAFNLGSGALERHIDQAIAGRRGEGNG